MKLGLKLKCLSLPVRLTLYTTACRETQALPSHGAVRALGRRQGVGMGPGQIPFHYFQDSLGSGTTKKVHLHRQLGVENLHLGDWARNLVQGTY